MKMSKGETLARYILDNTRDGDVVSVAINIKSDREAVAMLVNGAIRDEIGFRIVSFEPDTVQLQRY